MTITADVAENYITDYIKGSHRSTLTPSLRALDFLSPLSGAVHYWAINSQRPQLVEVLHYFANLIDTLIRVVALPIFVLVDHFRDMVLVPKWWKVICSPITIPLKLVYALFLGAALVVVTCFLLVFPLNVFTAVRAGEQGARDFFNKKREQKEWVDQAVRACKNTMPILAPIVLSDCHK